MTLDLILNLDVTKFCRIWIPLDLVQFGCYLILLILELLDFVSLTPRDLDKFDCYITQSVDFVKFGCDLILLNLSRSC